MRAAGRDVWVKIRASEAERAEWHAKARSAGLTLSDLVRRSVRRVRPWTVAHAEVERERTRELARIGANLNQIARWANTFKANAEAVEIVATGSPSSERSGHWPPSGTPTPMHIKFLARGTGSARAAADYLLGTRDAAGQLRAGVEVLQGDPHQVAAVADALAFEHKYTSGVIAWAGTGRARCPCRSSRRDTGRPLRSRLDAAEPAPGAWGARPRDGPGLYRHRVLVRAGAR